MRDSLAFAYVINTLLSQDPNKPYIEVLGTIVFHLATMRRYSFGNPVRINETLTYNFNKFMKIFP